MPTNRGDENWGLTLEILSAKGDAVEGLAQRAGKGGCVGDYPVAGTAKGDALTLRATKKGGVSGDCRIWFNLKVEGNKLVGTMNDRWAVELSR